MPSSVIASYSYSEEDKVLKVIFLSGLIYDYLDVPLAVYQRMKNSLSKQGCCILNVLLFLGVESIS